MVKYNKVQPKPPVVAPIQTAAVATGRTHNNAPGFARDAKSELFLLAVSSFAGEDTFYEKASDRSMRYRTLIHQVAREDHQWLARFLPWLRNDANMRTASVVGAVEAAFVMAQEGTPGGRQIVAASMSRADEPGEALAYAMGYGRTVPKPVKRGIADAATRLYTQYSALKYDTASKGLRFGDVLELTHAAPARHEQGDLFKWLVTRAHHRDLVEYPETLTMLQANVLLRRDAAKRPEVLLNTARLRQAGMTWEDVKSLVGSKLPDKDVWTALAPTLGYMALLRNLRNLDQAGISNDLALVLATKLGDPAEVAKSRQLPMRFLSAHREMVTNNWSRALDLALEASLANVPKLEGRTLVLVDTSGSMNDPLSAKSKLMRWDAAVIFALALAKANDLVDVVSFSDSSKVFPAKTGESLLKGIDRWKMGGYFYAHGTATQAAVRTHYRGHDTVVIITDEQANYHTYRDVAASVPQDKLVVTFNLAGYEYGHAAGGPHRITIGGLSDAAFKLLPALEHRARGGWPF